MSLMQSLAHDWGGEGATVGTLDTVPSDPVQALREAAAGNALGMVDEAHCLALIGVLSDTQAAQVAADNGIMTRLGWAFNNDELRKAAELGDRRMAKKFFIKRFGIKMKGRFEDAGGDQTSNQETGRAGPGETLLDWEHQDILDVWDQLALLPVQDVSENTAIKAFESISGTGAYWSGGPGEVQIGQAINDDPAHSTLDHTVRHEIGHAVHDLLESSVNAWLEKQVGFYVLGYGRDGCQALVDSLGGFPSGVDQDHVLDLLDTYLNSESWGTANPMPDKDDDWKKMPASVKTAVEQSENSWYMNYKKHPKGSKGRVFFNHWYDNTMCFSAVAEQAINATGDDYSAMSPSEFFANCYAEFFGDPAGYTDPKKWGGKLPGTVQTFFRNHILDRQPYAAPEDKKSINPALTTNNESGIPQ